MTAAATRNQIKAAYEEAARAYPLSREPLTVAYSPGWWTRNDGVKFRQSALEKETARLLARAVARLACAEDTMFPAWSVREDEFLIAYGGCMGDGYAFVASHDLGRGQQDGRDRIAWLRLHRPMLVALIEGEAA